eukprot:1787711-Rhodomonas_salina.2
MPVPHCRVNTRPAHRFYLCHTNTGQRIGHTQRATGQRVGHTQCQYRTAHRRFRVPGLGSGYTLSRRPPARRPAICYFSTGLRIARA